MARREVVRLYDQDVTNFELRLHIRPDAVTDGELAVALGEHFMRTLVLPGCALTSLWTRRPVEDAKLNVGDFSPSRWTAAATKLRAGTYNVLELVAQHPGRPNHQMMFGVQINPPAERREYSVPIVGKVDLHCSLSYLRELAESAERIAALLALGTMAWNGTPGAAYGFASIAYFQKIVPFNPVGPQDPDYVLPWDRPRDVPDVRPHPIPVAFVGLNVDTNLEDAYCAGRGIKGAFWANFLSKVYVEMAGGAARVRSSLPGCRVDPLRDDGLLIVAADSPLPEDTEETRQRFLTVHQLLQPTFISRTETAELKRPLLGYFYRERASIIP